MVKSYGARDCAKAPRAFGATCPHQQSLQFSLGCLTTIAVVKPWETHGYTAASSGLRLGPGSVDIPLRHIESIDEPLELVGQRDDEGVLIMVAERLPNERGQRPRQLRTVL